MTSSGPSSPAGSRPDGRAVALDDVTCDLRDITITSRQREILELLAGGASSKQAARALGVSTRTIDKHLELAYRALGVTTRIQALRALGCLSSP